MKKIYFTFPFENNWLRFEIEIENQIINTFLNNIGEDLIITPKVSDYIRYLKTSKNKIIPNIIDIECLIKQLEQKGKDLIISSKKWSFLRALKDREIIDYNFNLTHDTLHHFTNISISYLKKLITESDEDEKQRLFTIEIPINKIIYQREFLGLHYDNQEVPSYCQKLEMEIYKRKNILQLEYGIFNPDDSHEQLKYIKSRNYTLIKESIYNTFKRNQYDDVVCCLFYEIIRYQRDLESFIFINSFWGGKNKCYPSYFGFGSITSRITMKEPSIQNLRREARKVLIPEDGKKFLYIDYSQFEAGILAALSNDQKLIDLFNQGNIYNSLGENLYPDEQNKELKREKSKEDFYAYVYSDEVKGKSKEYFSEFSALEKYKKKLKQELLDNAKVSSDFGNSRILGNVEESNWYLSHKIQSTASLIYKKALLKVYSDVTDAEFLIPMHDGTLYQLPDNAKYNELKNAIKNIYINTFKDFFPLKNFYPDVKIKEKFE
ncbi:DNA polymerase [Chryseobacterium arthrosphaerae]|uniref:DNA polymerase n=1 Tax=Chryseobacterium arthrosphaerae TaxID=651561 RepID=UPI00241D2EEE|nr:DNA polymerase [Chryseobacterium arthrosphaerae]